MLKQSTSYMPEVTQTLQQCDIVTCSLINTVYLDKHTHHQNHVLNHLLNSGLVQRSSNSSASLCVGFKLVI